MRIVFTGDSITDVARNREERWKASSLGSGYPLISAARYWNHIRMQILNS